MADGEGVEVAGVAEVGGEPAGESLVAEKVEAGERGKQKGLAAKAGSKELRGGEFAGGQRLMAAMGG